MDDRQSLAFDKLMKEQKNKKSVLLSIVLVAAVLVFLLGLLVGIAFSSNALAVPVGAEDLVREDPLLVGSGPLRSQASPTYLLSSSGYSAFVSWLSSEGYTSSSSVYSFSDNVFCYNSSDMTSYFFSYGFYASGSALYSTVSGGSSRLVDSSYYIGFDSDSIYHFFRYTVGVGASDFVVEGFGSPLALAEDAASSIFTVGSKLLAFVTNNVLVLIPLVLFLGVFAFGSIKRLITGV